MFLGYVSFFLYTHSVFAFSFCFFLSGFIPFFYACFFLLYYFISFFLSFFLSFVCFSVHFSDMFYFYSSSCFFSSVHFLLSKLIIFFNVSLDKSSSLSFFLPTNFLCSFIHSHSNFFISFFPVFL